jgi:hypothetical protein
MWKTMKDRIVSRIALNNTPAAPRKVAKASSPAVVYNWTRNPRRVGPATKTINNRATNNRTLETAANGILTFTYH